MNRIIKHLDLNSRTSFKTSAKSLSDEVKRQLQDALKKLIVNPQPKSLRLEKLSGYKNPNIYTIHITPNHSHKLSFELNGDVAILRRVGTHKEIDRTP